MSLSDDARGAGEAAVDKLQVKLSERLADMLRGQPDLVASAIEVGLIDRAWLDEPGRHPIRTAGAIDVVQRFLERSAERHPSTLAAIGLNTIQLLSYPRDGNGAEGPSVPLAVAFTDLEGFTRYTAVNGDEAASAILGEHHRMVGPVVRSRGGRIVKRIGDGLLLSFPAPEAAVLAALELLDTAPAPLTLRAGINYGDVVATGDDVIGNAVNLAARVTEAARGGEVLATVAVRDAAERDVGELRGVAFRRPRRRSFKGLSESVLVTRVERSA
jgi:adenylate cyclase